jgi:hypothetical protein
MRVARLLLSMLAIAIAIIAVDQLRSMLTTRMQKITEETEVYALPPPEYVRALSLGHRDAVASILWASTLYQYGDRVSHNRRFEYPTQYVETILALDPGFRPAYRFLSTLTTMQVVAPTREQIDRTAAILERGTRELPNDADVWGAYASFMMFEGAQYLGEAEKKRWRVLGAPAAQRAVELGYFMESLSITGALFLERAGERDLAIAQLERAFAVAPNDETREKIVQKLRALQAQDAVGRVQRSQNAMFTTWRDRYPWLTETMFTLVGPQHDVLSCAGLAGTSARCTPGWTGFLNAAPR